VTFTCRSASKSFINKSEEGVISNGILDKGNLRGSCVHICCDMQRMFAEQTEWHTPWMKRVIPYTRRIVEAHPAHSIFTRFIPACRPGDGHGTWKRYYQRWASMTLEHLGAGLIDLVPELAAFVPPGEVIDKWVYSPWMNNTLADCLERRGSDTIVVTGGETDVCVLATVLGAIDRGYRVIVASDAICSSADETHDASLRLYHDRYGQQVEIATTEQILSCWDA
jgi:nicotinamidase-related amidase